MNFMDLATLRSQLDQGHRDLDRARRLIGSRAPSPADLDAAEACLRNAEDRMRTARIGLGVEGAK